jgi:SAM-dependent methyltransferase
MSLRQAWERARRTGLLNPRRYRLWGWLRYGRAKLREYWYRAFITGPLDPRRRVLWFCVKHGWGRGFRYGGRRYRYAFRMYNETYNNERAVELPVVWRILRGAAGTRVLEVGNVLSHYYPISHPVVDKYEQAPGVLNCDVVDYNPGDRFDLIISISTLEHVGWDEEPRDPDKILVAIDHLTDLLAPGGRLVFTIPLGYHTGFDAHLKAGGLKLDERHYLTRIAEPCTWVEVPIEQVGWTYPGNLLIATIFAPKTDAPATGAASR